MDDPVPLSLAHARRFAWPIPDLWHSASLSEHDLRAYYRFRRQFMDLKPHVDPDKDWAYFAAWVKAADYCWFERSRGHLQAACAFKIEPRVHQGRPLTLVWAEYLYSRPGSRKSLGLAGAMVTALTLAVARSPRAPAYVVGAGYVASSIALAQVFDSVWFHDEPTMSPWEQSLWRSLAGATAGYDPATKLVTLGTVPRNPRTTPPVNPKVYEAWHRYVTHNPAWFEGTACFCMGRLERSMLTNTLHWFRRRLQRT